MEKRKTRRSFLGEAAGVVGGAAIVGVGLHEANKILGSKKKDEGEPHQERAFEDTFELAGLSGRRNGGLAEWYLDCHDKYFPESITTSFPNNLAQMWNGKLKNASATTPDSVLSTIEDFGNARAEEYAAHWKRGPEAIGVADVPEGLTPQPHFTRLVNEFSATESEVLANIDWGTLADAYGLKDKDDWYINMLGHLASRAQGRSLAAYSMTEIMPFGGREENLALYDFMLKNAGTEFIARIPALYDGLISYGPFQFTKFAIDYGINAPRHPLAVNQYLPAHLRVPERITEFVSNDGHPLRHHAAAAVLFGLQNIAIATRTLMAEGRGSPALEAVADMDGGTFASVLAMHHYRPSEAHGALVNWAHQVERGEASKPCYAYATDPEVQRYGKISAENFNLIQHYFEASGNP